MNDILEQIRRPIADDLVQYDRFLRSRMRSEDDYMSGILNYIFENGGKGVRPMLVLLCAALNSARPKEGVGLRAYLSAMLVEMMHTASLVHDDVIDESDLRRGKPSIRAMLNSRGAVITGDFILAKSMALGMDSGQFDIVSYVVRAMSELCEGELIQSMQSAKLEMTRPIYMDIIRKKTATLFGVSAGAGAMSSGASSEKVATMRRFGECVGMIFQIRDDILDYDAYGHTGKPANNDLKERKITLPLLFALERATEAEKRTILEKLSMAADDPASVTYLNGLVASCGGIDESVRVMREYLTDAMAMLSSYPVSDYLNSLLLLANYAAERDK